jgi:hypothetical protein
VGVDVVDELELARGTFLGVLVVHTFYDRCGLILDSGSMPSRNKIFAMKNVLEE